MGSSRAANARRTEARDHADLRATAAWRTSADIPFVARKSRLREPHHPLVSSRYFCSMSFFFMDLMHLVDCKGAASLVHGGALSFLIRLPASGVSIADRLERINADSGNYYDRNPGMNR
eukprot:4014264-Pyramimonas_sp.AAC.1